MGSPIDSWEGAAAYFTGAGGITPIIFLILSVVACFGALYIGGKHEEEAYKEAEKK
jgi:hypothetical protein